MDSRSTNHSPSLGSCRRSAAMRSTFSEKLSSRSTNTRGFIGHCLDFVDVRNAQVFRMLLTHHHSLGGRKDGSDQIAGSKCVNADSIPDHTYSARKRRGNVTQSRHLPYSREGFKIDRNRTLSRTRLITSFKAWRRGQQPTLRRKLR